MGAPVGVPVVTEGRTMTPAAFDAALVRLGIADRPELAAALLNVTPRCVRRWRRGERRIAGPVVVLLEMLVALL